MRSAFFVLIAIFTASSAGICQVNINRYAWETPVVTNIQGADDLIAELREHIQEVLDAGSLAPLYQPYTDNFAGLGMYLYQEPGRMIQTLAMAYPYLTPAQQLSARNYVASELGSSTFAPWAPYPVPRNYSTHREWYFPVDRIWKQDNPFGNQRPYVQTLYGVWLYGAKTGDWAAIEPYWPNLRQFYLDRSYQGELYGTMGAHIAAARLAERFGDSSLRTQALANLQTQLNDGLNFDLIEERCWNRVPDWTSPYRYEYLQARWGMIRGFMFLGLCPEIGRYLGENVQAPVAARIQQAKSRFPLWWVLQSPYSNEWTGEEAIGYPAEVFGMIPPVERWALGVDAETLGGYHRSSPNGIGDCYWLESLVCAIEARGTTTWQEVGGARSIASAKRGSDATDATIYGAVVTGVFADYFYIESDDRSSGIRVNRPGHTVSQGSRVNIVGSLGTNSDGERYIAAATIENAGSGTIVPLQMTNGNLGGSDFPAGFTGSAGQRGVQGGVGLNNIGLLVRTAGIVTQSAPGQFTISDGSLTAGLEVSAPGMAAPPVDTFVTVTGISSCRSESGNLIRVLRPRVQSDITTHGYFGPPDQTPPAAISNLAVSSTGPYSATLTWTATGNDGATGTAASYDMRYYSAPITEVNWPSAVQVTGEPVPQPAGSVETHTVTGLSPLTNYYFAVKAVDPSGNQSPVSNSPQGTTLSDQANNLLQNGNFETGAISPWNGFGISVTSDSAYLGSYGLRMTGSGSADQTFATVPGSTYYASGWIRIDQQTTAPTWGGLRIQITDYSSWQELATSDTLTAANSPVGVWTRVDFSFTAISASTRFTYHNFSNGQFNASADGFYASSVPLL